MKIQFKYFNGTLSAICLTVIFVLSNCGSDPAKKLTAEERVTAMLVSNGGKWTPPSTGGVIIDGIDVTQDLFPNFSITFSPGAFSTTGTSPVWLRNDTWTFKDETATVIVRGQDGKEVTITEISNTQLRLSLVWTETTYSGGRLKSLAGRHEFVLNK